MNNVALRRAGVVLGTLVLSACAEQGSPLTSELPAPTPLASLAQLDCTVSTREKTLSCGSATRAGDARSLIVGGQGTYVNLQASNHAFLSGDNVYSFDVSVQNLIPQALGTTDGAALDPAGVRVFFDQEPVATEGTIAPITVLNAAGRETFMRSDQLYYQWYEMLGQNQTSGSQTWEFAVDPLTTRFQFKVYVAAPVQFPDGWIDLTPGADTLVAGSSVLLVPTVRDVVGRPVAGPAVTWGSSDAGVATVDAAGSLTAAAPGLVTITAASGARVGTATVAVCPNLAVGGVYTVSMPTASSLCFAGAAGAAAEYAYMPLNFSTASSLALDVTGNGIVSIVGPPSPALMPNPLFGRAGASRLRESDDWHLRQLRQQGRELARLRERPGALITRGARPRRPRSLITKGPGTAVGDLMTLNTASGCSGTREDQIGRVVAVGGRVIIVADTMNPSGGFTTAQFDSIALEFDTLAHPVNVDNFGAPTDLDGNGRVVAFYTRTVNLLTPAGSGFVVGGYVNARDLFSADPAVCPRSNEGEIFYMRVPDPAAETGNVADVSTVRSGTVATLAHEFQHLINASRRLYVNAGAEFPETVWLNEGISHIAEELMFYRASGLTPRSNITLSTITTTQARIKAFNSYSNQNFGRFRSWLQRPDTSGPLRANDVLATRGATWSFLRYAADRRGGTESELWFNLVNSLTTGTTTLQTAFGAAPTDWVRDWVAAVYADDVVTGLPVEHTTPSWHFRSVYDGLNGFSLGTRPLSNGVTTSFFLAPGGSTAFVRFGVPANAFAGVTALSGGAVPTSPFGFIVVRTK